MAVKTRLTAARATLEAQKLVENNKKDQNRQNRRFSDDQSQPSSAQDPPSNQPNAFSVVRTMTTRSMTNRAARNAQILDCGDPTSQNGTESKFSPVNDVVAAVPSDNFSGQPNGGEAPRKSTSGTLIAGTSLPRCCNCGSRDSCLEATSCPCIAKNIKCSNCRSICCRNFPINPTLSGDSTDSEEYHTADEEEAVENRDEITIPDASPSMLHNDADDNHRNDIEDEDDDDALTNSTTEDHTTPAQSAREKLATVYEGQTTHDTDGTETDGGVDDNYDDRKMIEMFDKVTDYHADFFPTPAQKFMVGRRFIANLIDILKGIRERRYNSEYFILYCTFILRVTPGVKKARIIHKIIEE